MSIIHCDACRKPVDTDLVDMERFPVGDDDSIQLCPACAAEWFADQHAEMTAARRDYDIAPLSERNPEQYRQDMIAAGRGHLLAEFWGQ